MNYLPLNQNKVQKRDIHTRKELWQQKIKLFDLKKFDKDFWDKNYEFLPLPKTYNRIQKKVKDWIDKNKDAESQYLELQKKLGETLIELAQNEQAEKRELKRVAFALSKNNWEQIEKINQEKIKDSRINELVEEYKKIKEELREPCYIIYHENNVLLFTYHNIRGADLELSNYGFLYRNKLYFISKFTYIDNAKLYCQVEAYVDKIYLYYGNYLRGMGTIKIQEAPLFLEDLNLCYSFCEDLGNVKLLETRGDWQPRFKCMYFDLSEIKPGKMTWKTIGEGDNDKEFRIPIDFEPKSAGWFRRLADKAKDKQILAFITPDDYYDDKNVLYRKFSKSKSNGQGDYQEISLPSDDRGENWFNKFPHLVYGPHCVVQIFFLNKLIHTGFLNQFQIREEVKTNSDSLLTRRKFYIQYLVQQKANPAGIYYYFKSGAQIWKNEIAVSRVFNQTKLLGGIIDTVAKVGGAIVGGASGGTAGAKVGSAVGKAVSGFLTKKNDVYKALGFEGGEKEMVENEEQTRRMYNSPNKNLIKHTEPALFYPNTVDLKYDMFEFANRYTYPYIKWRFSISNNLVNALENSNNYSHLLNINTTFNTLGSLIKRGFWRAELNLKTNCDGLMKEIFAKGVHFYEDLEKDFPNPVLKNTNISNVNVFDVDDSSIVVGEETLESQSFTHQINYQADKREYSHATYFCFNTPDNTQQDLENQQRFISRNSAFESHYIETGTSHSGCCWGCTYDALKDANFLKMSLTPSKDCSFRYLLEKGSAPTERQLKAEQLYIFDFTPTDILISWTVYKRETEIIDNLDINPDDLREQNRSDNEEIPTNIDELSEDDGENEERNEQENQEELEESASESSDDGDYQESSSEASKSSSESGESSDEQTESEESDDDEEDTDDYASSEEE